MKDNKLPIYTGILKNLIVDFIKYKQSQGIYKKVPSNLKQIDRFTLEYNLTTKSLPKDFVEQWCILRPNEAPRNRECRITLLRQFALYLSELGIEVYMPPVLRNIKKDYVPYIFSKEEIIRLFNIIDNIAVQKWTNGHLIYPIIFRMLYGCGLRISEVTNLKFKNIDFEKGVLQIIQSKFEKDRLVPMSNDLHEMVLNYANKYHINSNNDCYFFTTQKGSQCNPHSVYTKFRDILLKAKIPYLGKGKGPRLHDFRHTFAIYSLKQLLLDGLDLYTALPILSAYMGHSSIETTEKYIRLIKSMFPDLISQIEHINDYVFPEEYYYETN